MMKRRKVGNLLALAVLATLVQRPMHPYEIASFLRSSNKDQDMPIKWGSFYTVVGNLERHGFLEAVESNRQGARPERTVYRITDAGRAELDDWVRELIAVPEPEPTRFKAALSVLAVLSPEQAADLLRQRLHALDAQITDGKAGLEAAAGKLPRLFLIEEEYDLALRSAEAEWVRGVLTELTSGTFPMQNEWRAFHETGEMTAELAELAEKGIESGD